MVRYLAPLIAFAILIPVLMIGLTKDPSRLPSPLIGKPAPSFELPSLGEPARHVGTSDIAGKIALVNVWATWCVGCREEHGFLMQLAESGAVPVYGINWRDNRDDALRWLEQLGDPYEFTAFDQDGRVGIDWGVYGAPESFLVDANGVVVHKHLGPLNPENWQRDFVPLIRAAGAGE